MTKTALYNSHINANAKMISFNGYQLPVQYTNIKEEYDAVRNHCGIFDISHMGNFLITGKQALLYLQKLVVSDISKLNDLDLKYTAMCDKKRWCY